MALSPPLPPDTASAPGGDGLSHTWREPRGQGGPPARPPWMSELLSPPPLGRCQPCARCGDWPVRAEAMWASAAPCWGAVLGPLSWPLQATEITVLAGPSLGQLRLAPRWAANDSVSGCRPGGNVLSVSVLSAERGGVQLAVWNWERWRAGGPEANTPGRPDSCARSAGSQAGLRRGPGP